MLGGGKSRVSVAKGDTRQQNVLLLERAGEACVLEFASRYCEGNDGTRKKKKNQTQNAHTKVNKTKKNRRAKMRELMKQTNKKEVMIRKNGWQARGFVYIEEPKKKKGTSKDKVKTKTSDIPMHTIEECILMCWYPVFSAQTCGILTPLNLVSAIGKRGRRKKKKRERIH